MNLSNRAIRRHQRAGFPSGVIDPTKVTRSALQNDASIARLMLTTEALVAEIPEKKSASGGGPGGHDHGGGGMDY